VGDGVTVMPLRVRAVVVAAAVAVVVVAVVCVVREVRCEM